MSVENSGHATVQQLTANQSSTTATLPQYSVPAAQLPGGSKYNQLLSVSFSVSSSVVSDYFSFLLFSIYLFIFCY